MILGIIIGLCLAAVGLFLYNRLTDRKFNPNLDFKNKRKEVVQQFKQKKNARLKEIDDAAAQLEEELYKSYETTVSTLQAKETKLWKDYQNRELKLKESYRQKEQDLKESYQKEQDFLKSLADEQAAARAEQSIKDLAIEEEKQKNSLEELKKEYQEKVEKQTLDFLAFSEQIGQKKEKIQAEIEDYEEKQRQLIARFQKDEELRSQRDFYKIEISQSAAQDIAKLKNLALNFNKPDAIYKLIWEVYYKAPIEALFKKILGENSARGGIYKITNVKNEKVYVGRSTKFIDRWRTHSKRGCGIETIKGLLYEAMIKEGLENFTFEVLEVCEKEIQSEREKYWIKFYKSDEWGYNQTKGG